MPSIELQDIQSSILRSEDLFQDGVPITFDLEEKKLINCYAFSVGITYPKDIFNPGFSQNLQYYGREPEEIMVKTYIDLETLGKRFRRLGLENEIILGENEYLIKAFYTPPNKKSTIGDFHFIRQDKQTGFWFQKYKGKQPEILPPNLVPKLGPDIINASFDDGSVFKYEAVGYFAITEESISN